ncbi:MAG TPA: myxococcus cysteine-rich repeat containing protein, partial [Candidatus Peribacteria bacterium]|nr:myxococcus cysteine-rich repeat containing protein [Candidatus Peribacteria bacterium]
ATCTVESGYVCDAGTPNICTKTCGDGTRGQGEACDDGNEDSGDGCSATCTVENGYTCNTDTPNVCDPNGANAVCGNGVREGDLCGNQFVDNDEECDYAVDCAGVADGQTCSCHADCTICDGNEDCTFTAPNYNGETCDDGDTDAGDGCSATCDVETDYSCDTATPNVCSFDGNMCTYQTIGNMSLSDDGRYTAYLTAGSGAVTDFQVVLYDRVADTSVAVTNINATPQDGVPNWADAGPYISGNGRYLAFDGIVTGVSKKLTIYDRVNDTYAVLATSGSFMQLSDDGNALVYQYQGCIIVYDKTSGNYTNVAGPNADCLAGVTPVTNNGDPIVATTEIPYEGVISGNGRYAFFLVPNTGVPEILGSPQKDVYRVDLTNNATVLAATAQVGSHLSVTADGNIVFYSFTLTGEYDEATYNFTTQTSSEFDMQGVLAGGLDTNIDQISSDGTIYQIFGGVGPNGVRQAVYSATTQQVIYEVPDVLNAFIFLSGDGNNLAYVSDTPGGPTGHWSVFVRNIVQESTKIAPSEYQCQ